MNSIVFRLRGFHFRQLKQTRRIPMGDALGLFGLHDIFWGQTSDGITLNEPFEKVARKSRILNSPTDGTHINTDQ